MAAPQLRALRSPLHGAQGRGQQPRGFLSFQRVDTEPPQLQPASGERVGQMRALPLKLVQLDQAGFEALFEGREIGGGDGEDLSFTITFVKPDDG